MSIFSQILTNEVSKQGLKPLFYQNKTEIVRYFTKQGGESTELFQFFSWKLSIYSETLKFFFMFWQGAVKAEEEVKAELGNTYAFGVKYNKQPKNHKTWISLNTTGQCKTNIFEYSKISNFWLWYSALRFFVFLVNQKVLSWICCLTRNDLLQPRSSGGILIFLVHICLMDWKT